MNREMKTDTIIKKLKSACKIIDSCIPESQDEAEKAMSGLEDIIQMLDAKEKRFYTREKDKKDDARTV